jgi:hypothetical protein
MMNDEGGGETIRYPRRDIFANDQPRSVEEGDSVPIQRGIKGKGKGKGKAEKTSDKKTRTLSRCLAGAKPRKPRQRRIVQRPMRP